MGPILLKYRQIRQLAGKLLLCYLENKSRQAVFRSILQFHGYNVTLLKLRVLPSVYAEIFNIGCRIYFSDFILPLERSFLASKYSREL